MKQHRITKFLALLIALSLLVAACGGDDDGETAPPDDGDTADDGDGDGGDDGDGGEPAADAPPREADDDTLVVAWTGDLNSLDPPDSLVEWNREVTVNVYETLVRYKLDEQPDGTYLWDGLEVEPHLAESWDIDGATVTFNLRDDVTFYPSGNPMTAEDVKYSFVRMQEVPGFGRFNANLGGIFDPEEQIEVVDDHTVRITYRTSDGEDRLVPLALPSLRFPQFAILDSQTVEEHATDSDPWAAEWMKENVAGSGPYYVASRTPGTETELQVVPDYWGEPPAIERVILRVLGSSSDIISLVRRGGVDMTANLQDRDFDAVEEAGYDVINAEVPDIVRLHFSTGYEPLDDKLVRQALAYAMPYEALLENAFAGRGSRAYSYVNPQSPGFKESFDRYSYDLDRARELLEEAGMEDGFDIDIHYDSGLPVWENIALLIQDSLRQIDVTANLVPAPTAQFAEETAARGRGEEVQTGIALRRSVIWLDDPDPNTAVWVATGATSNTSDFSNATVDELHNEFRFSLDEAERAAAYEEIQDIVAEEVPLVPLVVVGRSVAIHPSFTGLSFTADPHSRFYTIRQR